MSYRIASFNMYKMNLRHDKEISKNLKKIAKIILDNDIDIIAMQEVLSPNAIKKNGGLLDYLPGWAYKWEQPRIKISNVRVKGYSMSQQEAEGYAFLWNTKRFKLPTKKTSSGFVYDVDPRIYNQYRVNSAKNQQPLVRNPYYGRFIPLDAAGQERNFELRLINTHIIFGKSGMTNIRSQEFEILVDQIYKRVSCSDIPKHPIYTIMLGDYNLNLHRPHTKSPYLSENLELYRIEEMQVSPNGEKNKVYLKTIRTVQESLSTLKQPNRENFDPNRALANNYDHFSYDQKYDKDKIVSKAYLINAPRKYYKKNGEIDYVSYKKEVSDHLPISININL